MTDWIADGISFAALLLAGLSFLGSWRQGRRQAGVESRVAQIEEDRRSEELRPQLVVEDFPGGRVDDHGFAVRIRSQCDRLLHVGMVSVIDDPAAPSAVAGLVSRHTVNIVQEEDTDAELRPHGALVLELRRKESLRNTDGTGRITLQIEEPGTDRSWPVTVVVRVPSVSGEAPHVETGRGGQ